MGSGMHGLLDLLCLLLRRPCRAHSLEILNCSHPQLAMHEPQVAMAGDEHYYFVLPTASTFRPRHMRKTFTLNLSPCESYGSVHIAGQRSLYWLQKLLRRGDETLVMAVGALTEHMRNQLLLPLIKLTEDVAAEVIVREWMALLDFITWEWVEPLSEWVSEWVKERASEWEKEWVSECRNESMHEWDQGEHNNPPNRESMAAWWQRQL